MKDLTWIHASPKKIKTIRFYTWLVVVGQLAFAKLIMLITKFLGQKWKVLVWSMQTFFIYQTKCKHLTQRFYKLWVWNWFIIRHICTDSQYILYNSMTIEMTYSLLVLWIWTTILLLFFQALDGDMQWFLRELVAKGFQD